LAGIFYVAYQMITHSLADGNQTKRVDLMVMKHEPLAPCAVLACDQQQTLVFKKITGLKLSLGLIALFLASAATAQDDPQTNLQRTALQAGMHRIDAQVALTPEQRQIGLMWRKTMPAHEGMLFVFEAPSKQCFWMKNTLLPLTAAFVDEDGSIVNLEDMKPQTLEPHCSAKPVRYVLEMNKGWFAKKGIKVGTKLTGVPFTAK
jgi:uncharacterized protein